MNVPSYESFPPRYVCSLGLAANLACTWEATAAKPGNVNRNSDFDDLTLVDFLASGAMVADVLHRMAVPHQVAEKPALGRLVLDMVKATGAVSVSNSNLGICLLLAPLAIAYLECRPGNDGDSPLQAMDAPAVSVEQLKAALRVVLESAASDDTRHLYRAIALSQAGGLGKSEQADIHAPDELTPADTPVHVMTVAKDRDSIALEYATGFSQTFDLVLPSLLNFLQRGYPLQWAIIGCQVETMAKQVDTLIQRKLGPTVAEDIRCRCQQLWQNWQQGELESWATFQKGRLENTLLDLQELDFYLRADEHRRNPGTTADLIAGALFTGLLTGQISPGTKW